jgi:hypothetical protein
MPKSPAAPSSSSVSRRVSSSALRARRKARVGVGGLILERFNADVPARAAQDIAAELLGDGRRGRRRDGSSAAAISDRRFSSDRCHRATISPWRTRERIRPAGYARGAFGRLQRSSAREGALLCCFLKHLPSRKTKPRGSFL